MEQSSFCEKPTPKYFNFVLTLFVATWLISDILAIKIVHFWGITLTGGFLTFPLTMALNFLLVDVYGFKNARQAIWCGCIVNLCYVVFLFIICSIPGSPEWKLQSQFEAILFPHSRIVFASLISFWVSGFLSSYLMSNLKLKGISFLTRILISSSVGIIIDITMFFSIGLLDTMPFYILKKIFLFAIIKKFICELLLLPLIWLFIDKIKELEGFEIIDNNISYTPFSIENVYDINNYKKYYREKPSLHSVVIK